MRKVLKKIISPLLQKASALYLKKRRKYTYKEISVWVEPSVFPPFITISTKLLLEFVETLDIKGKSFLELGCGCGIISILAAKNGATVTASDINQIALDALSKNGFTNKVALEVINSDLFENLGGRTFDFILINPPFYPKNPLSTAERAWYCGENFEYFEDLFFQLKPFLRAKNNTFMILSEDCQIEQIKTIASKNALSLLLIKEQKVLAETNYIYRIKLG